MGVITGGFTRSPLYIDFNISKGLEEIESVTLLVDGTMPMIELLAFGNDSTNNQFQLSGKNENDHNIYSFSWVPEETGDYSLSVRVEDTRNFFRQHQCCQYRGIHW